MIADCQEERGNNDFSEIRIGNLAAVTACGASTEGALAHNAAKYTNIPFAVAATCPYVDTGVSAGWISFYTGTQLRVVADAGGQSGFDVFASIPASVNGILTTASGQYLPYNAGNVTFNISGLPAGGAIIWQAVYSDGTVTAQPAQPGTFVYPVNGLVTIPSGANNGQSAGAGLTMVKVYVQTIGGSTKDTTGSYATVNLSNFRLNNSVLLGDTTVTDETNNIASDAQLYYYYCS